MSPVLIQRSLLVVALVAVAALASWLIPRAATPPDRFTLAMELIDQGRAAEAVYLLEDPEWRGVAEYRAGRHRRALYLWIRGKGVRDLYNVGNAYARLHTWGGAKSAYSKALRLDPGHTDAKHNLALVEKAELAEKKLAEDTRVTREMGRWKDGDREDDERGKEPATQTEKGGADQGAVKDADEEAAVAGTSTKLGKLGDKPKSEDPQTGASGGVADDLPPDGLEAGEGRVMILKESTQAAEVLLGQIRDNPERVLRARLKAAHRARTETEGACDGC